MQHWTGPVLHCETGVDVGAWVVVCKCIINGSLAADIVEMELTTVTVLGGVPPGIAAARTVNATIAIKNEETRENIVLFECFVAGEVVRLGEAELRKHGTNERYLYVRRTRQPPEKAGRT